MASTRSGQFCCVSCVPMLVLVGAVDLVKSSSSTVIFAPAIDEIGQRQVDGESVSSGARMARMPEPLSTPTWLDVEDSLPTWLISSIYVVRHAGNGDGLLAEMLEFVWFSGLSGTIATRSSGIQRDREDVRDIEQHRYSFAGRASPRPCGNFAVERTCSKVCARCRSRHGPDEGCLLIGVKVESS